ncbi:hypothetical protein ACA910_002163 [Epithemia clementina (nom. ined.)]
MPVIINRTRTYLELRVGEYGLVQVVLFLQSRHFEWFNNTNLNNSNIGEHHDKDDNNDNDNNNDNQDINQDSDGVAPRQSPSQQLRWLELYELIQNELLPRWLEAPIQDLYYSNRHSHGHHGRKRPRRGERNRPPELLGPGGIAITAQPLLSEDTNHHNILQANNNNAKSKPTRGGGGGRGRGRGRRWTKTSQQQQQRQQAALLLEQERLERRQQRTKQLVGAGESGCFYLAEGRTMQLWYQLEHAVPGGGGGGRRTTNSNSSSKYNGGGVTLVMSNPSSSDDHNDQDTTAAAKSVQFQALETLPLRFLIWCSPLNDDNDAQEQPQPLGSNGGGGGGGGGGCSATPAPKTEYIPLASLFRRSAGGK